MERRLIIRPLRFGYRLKKFVIIPFHFGIFFTHGNLKDLLVNHRMQGMDELIEQFSPKMLPSGTEEEKEALVLKMRSQLEQQATLEVEEYLPILYNQALVMVVTVFDGFLFDSLDIVTRKQPNLLKDLATEKDITVAQIIDATNYQTIFDSIQTRVLKRFDYRSIKEKVDALRKMGVDVDAALSFKFHKPSIWIRFPEGLQLLVNYYEQRHDIVHRDKHFLKSYEELEEIGLFFDGLLLSFGLAMGKHFQIETDWDLLMKGEMNILND